MKVTLPKQLDEFVSEQVQTGRFETGEAVIREAVWRMQEAERQREIEAFKSAFREIDEHSPPGEPTEDDLAQIERIVRSVRSARQQLEPA